MSIEVKKKNLGLRGSRGSRKMRVNEERAPPGARREASQKIRTVASSKPPAWSVCCGGKRSSAQNIEIIRALGKDKICHENGRSEKARPRLPLAAPQKKSPGSRSSRVPNYPMNKAPSRLGDHFTSASVDGGSISFACSRVKQKNNYFSAMMQTVFCVHTKGAPLPEPGRQQAVRGRLGTAGDARGLFLGKTNAVPPGEGAALRRKGRNHPPRIPPTGGWS